MKVWDVRRASGSVLTLDQHNGDKSKASSEAGTVASPLLFLILSVFHHSSLVSWAVSRNILPFYIEIKSTEGDTSTIIIYNLCPRRRLRNPT